LRVQGSALALLSLGFTLLEVLIALALLALVFVILSQAIKLGVQATAAHHRIVQAELAIEPVEHALRHLIERMDPGVYPQPPAVRGTASALAFTTELPDIATGGTMEADVRLEAAGGRLLLWWVPHGRGVPFAGPPAAQHTVLLEQVARLELAYAPKGEGAAWQPGWSAPALPGLVRVRLVPEQGGHAWPPIVVRPLREPAEE
jgi:general secretion pathway protein J